MSVAFRRDSDEEHLEPKFEIPLPAGPNLVTARGLALIESRIAELETSLAASSDEAATAAIKRDLRYWRQRRSSAELAVRPAGDIVGFGVTVRVLFNGKPRTFTIVGDDEADPANGMISFKSPLSQAMLGSEIDETLPFGNNPDAIRILGIIVDDTFGADNAPHPLAQPE
ncbi:nucleoside-diphosphate kinase [Erythrobacter arachoides]|uniref:Nucleoside-diphosphate kinase n=1 Tax=Aurantiacibacter arachoides TaxID=1850444 RepID=A0A844ZX31_9SPHN|nr:GreA/GreB family elongation factor [Aurantiacibacter arachoides]MXO92673.1 nucleoside-diphosphate kinase [Aurantiacibacter arachoides]GGD55325.1 transcription elongation factor GreB [Aurantiacibacter arachoides]